MVSLVINVSARLELGVAVVSFVLISGCFLFFRFRPVFPRSASSIGRPKAKIGKLRSKLVVFTQLSAYTSREKRPAGALVYLDLGVETAIPQSFGRPKFGASLLLKGQNDHIDARSIRHDLSFESFPYASTP